MGDLHIPPEPKDIKELITDFRNNIKTSDSIDADTQAVWYLNKLPRYLWNIWKDTLTTRGYNWQKFLRVIKLHTNDIILWALQNKLEWHQLIERITETLKRYEKQS